MPILKMHFFVHLGSSVEIIDCGTERVQRGSSHPSTEDAGSEAASKRLIVMQELKVFK